MLRNDYGADEKATDVCDYEHGERPVGPYRRVVLTDDFEFDNPGHLIVNLSKDLYDHIINSTGMICLE